MSERFKPYIFFFIGFLLIAPFLANYISKKHDENLAAIASEQRRTECFSNLENMTDDQKIFKAFNKFRLNRPRAQIVRSGYVANDAEIPGNKQFVPYDNFESFMTQNPKCCSVAGNVVHLNYTERFYDHKKMYREEMESVTTDLGDCLPY